MNTKTILKDTSLFYWGVWSLKADSQGSPRMITRTDMIKQKTSLMVSAIKFTEAGWKSYLFSAKKQKGKSNLISNRQHCVMGYLQINRRTIKQH